MARYVIYIPRDGENQFTPVIKTCKNWNKRGLNKIRERYPTAMMASEENFRKNIVRTIKVKSLMNSEVEVEYPSDTPFTCTVASETYWSS